MPRGNLVGVAASEKLAVVHCAPPGLVRSRTVHHHTSFRIDGTVVSFCGMLLGPLRHRHVAGPVPRDTCIDRMCSFQMNMSNMVVYVVAYAGAPGSRRPNGRVHTHCAFPSCESSNELERFLAISIGLKHTSTRDSLHVQVLTSERTLVTVPSFVRCWSSLGICALRMTSAARALKAHGDDEAPEW